MFLHLAVMLLLACNSFTLFAQTQGNNNGNNSTSSVVSSSKSFTMEAVIVTVLIVLALAAICKAVRRS